MRYNKEIYEAQIPLMYDFVHHKIIHSKIIERGNILGVNNLFWITTCNAHYYMAVVTWCKIFGNWKEDTHWSNNSFNDKQEFLNILFNRQHINSEIWGEYREGMKALRDKYIAHRDLRTKVNVVSLELAYQSVLILNEWIRSKVYEKTSDFYDTIPIIDKLEQETEIAIEAQIKNRVNHVKVETSTNKVSS